MKTSLKISLMTRQHFPQTKNFPYILLMVAITLGYLWYNKTLGIIFVGLFPRYGAPSKGPLMNKFKKDLNSATFMYQGKTLSTHPATSQKKNVTLKSFQGLKGSKEVLDTARKGRRGERPFVCRPL